MFDFEGGGNLGIVVALLSQLTLTDELLGQVVLLAHNAASPAHLSLLTQD